MDISNLIKIDSITEILIAYSRHEFPQYSIMQWADGKLTFLLIAALNININIFKKDHFMIYL